MGLAIHENAQKYYSKEIKSKESELFSHIVELEPLSEESIKEMLLE